MCRSVMCLTLIWMGIGLLRLAPARAAEVSTEVPYRSHVSWLADVQACIEKTPVPQDFSQLLRRPDGSVITTAREWLQRREEIRRWWLEFLNVPESDPQLPVRSLKMLSREETDGVVRCLIRYETQENWPTEAYVLFPRGHDPFRPSEKRLPGVVVFHSTTNDTIRQPAGLSAETTKAFGLHLAKRGYVTLCPRCFLWVAGPPYDYAKQVERFQQQFPGAKGMAKMLLDARAAVDLLAALPGVDPQRIGAVGHSLGAKEVLYLAALDGRIRASVASEGGVGLSFSNWDAPWYLGREIRAADFRHDHHELLAMIAPRAFLLIGGDSADGEKSLPYLRAAWEVYRLFGPRPALGLWNHRQGHTVPPDAESQIGEWLDAYLKR